MNNHELRGPLPGAHVLLAILYVIPNNHNQFLHDLLRLSILLKILPKQALYSIFKGSYLIAIYHCGRECSCSVADGPLTRSWVQKSKVKKNYVFSYSVVYLRSLFLNSLHKYGGAKAWGYTSWWTGSQLNPSETGEISRCLLCACARYDRAADFLKPLEFS